MEQEQQPFQPIQEQQVVKEKVSRLRMLFKIAFICNIFFIVCMIMRYSHADKFIPQPIVELSAILGWFLSPVLNVILVILSLVLVLKRGRGIRIRTWLILITVIFFIVQIFYFLLS